MNAPDIPGELHHLWLVTALALSDAESDVRRLTKERLDLVRKAWDIKEGDHVRIKGKIALVDKISLQLFHDLLSTRPTLHIRYYRVNGEVGSTIRFHDGEWEKVV